MRFSNIWPRIEARLPERQQFLLDLAYAVVLPPLLLMLKAPMLLFLLLVAALLAFKKRGTVLTLIGIGLAGLFAVFLALYGEFNFAGLSRLKLFVELMIYLLLLAVSLQRLTRKINFYLLISPALLLALSLFFFDSVTMLAYVVFEIFVLLWLALAYRMNTDAVASLRVTGMFFALSLPWVVLLFIFFPRISFEHASYGFHGEEQRRMGFDGLMHMDAGALLVPSERIVMEVSFPNGIPPENKLYFRGSVLYIDKGDHWEPLPPTVKRRFAPAKKAQNGMYQSMNGFTAYKVSLYPTYKRWLYLLDLPYEAPTGAKIDADFETTLKKPIDEPQYYDAGSALTYRYGKIVAPQVLRFAREYNVTADPKTYNAARKIETHYPDPQKRLAAVFRFFKDDNLTYTLQPEPLDLNHTADSFLFDKRRGYCVHFAGTFVTMARMAGLPARVVTGYKADRTNSVKNYLAVKEKDAHAWAEVYVKDHWQRVETTATASHIDLKSLALLRGTGTLEDDSGRLMRINLYLLYVKYQVQTWILQYSHFRQMQLLERFKKHPDFAVKFTASLLGVVLASIALFLFLRRPRCKEKILCMLRSVLKKLRKEGFVREDGETLHRFFERYLEAHPQSTLTEVDRQYQRLRYAARYDDTTALKRAVRAFLHEKTMQQQLPAEI
jgi:protein-glutamine gamma-glutamyltransferase